MWLFISMCIVCTWTWYVWKFLHAHFYCLKIPKCRHVCFPFFTRKLQPHRISYQINLYNFEFNTIFYPLCQHLWYINLLVIHSNIPWKKSKLRYAHFSPVTGLPPISVTFQMDQIRKCIQYTQFLPLLLYARKTDTISLFLFLLLVA